MVFISLYLFFHTYIKLGQPTAQTHTHSRFNGREKIKIMLCMEFTNKFDPLLCNRLYFWARRWPSKSVWCSTYVIEMVNDIICDASISNIWPFKPSTDCVTIYFPLCSPFSLAMLAITCLFFFCFVGIPQLKFFLNAFFAFFRHSFSFVLSLHFCNVHFDRKNSSHHKNMMMDH